jgi:hypothetical protein
LTAAGHSGKGKQKNDCEQTTKRFALEEKSSWFHDEIAFGNDKER